MIRARRRSITVQIEDDASISVRAPLLIPKILIDQFVKSRQPWIDKKLQHLNIQLSQIKRNFQNGDEYPFLGSYYKLMLTDEISGKLQFRDHFTLSRSAQSKAKTLFEKWYKKEANDYFLSRLDVLSKTLRVKYKKLHLSSGIRRWGSYSPASGTISLSWRLIMAPPEIIDYVIIHELSHIIEPNHGKHFWEIVAHFDADYKIHIKWLKNHGRTLVLC